MGGTKAGSPKLPVLKPKKGLDFKNQDPFLALIFCDYSRWHKFPKKRIVEVQENELWTVLRQPWTISRRDEYSIESQIGLRIILIFYQLLGLQGAGQCRGWQFFLKYRCPPMRVIDPLPELGGEWGYRNLR